jgi:hypothetical protein
LHLRVLELALSVCDEAFILMDRGELRIELLLRNRVFAVSDLVTREIDVGVLQ